MDAPFIFQRTAKAPYFAGRKNEVSHLATNFCLRTNTVLMSPQGWGKSSVVHMAAEKASYRDPALRFCHIDMSNVRSEEQFYALYAQSVLKAFASDIEGAVALSGRHFVKLMPKVVINPVSASGFTLDFDNASLLLHHEEILDLPERVAEDTGLKPVVHIDDFHNSAVFDRPEAFINRLDACWRKHKSVSYCLCAGRNDFMDRFLRVCRAFLIYGDRMFLDKVDREDMVSYIRERFSDTGKYIDNDLSGFIIDLVDAHPYYVQQLAALSWLRTGVVCSREIITAAHDSMVCQMGMIFTSLMTTFTAQQICYLHAVLAGEKVISTTEVLHKHHITSATSASRSKAALLERNIIGRLEDNSIVFTDPIFAHWLKTRYFTMD